MAGILDAGKLVATLGLNTAPFMASANGAMASLQAMSNTMMMVGRSMTRFITLPMVIAGGAALNTQKNFEKSMTKIIGLVGVSRGVVEGWTDAVLDMAVMTGRGPTELADALFFITSAGIRGAEALEVLEMSAKGAAVGMGDTKTIADLVTSAMNAYGKENLNAAQAVDILTATVREGKAEADSLASAMGFVIPIAAEFGVSFDQVGAAFAGMTRTGTSARVAATQLKAIISALASPSEQSADNMALFQKTAAGLRDTIKKEGLIAGLLELRTAVNADGAAFAGVFPNIRALMGVLDLLGKNIQSNVRIFEAIKNSTGSLDAAFKEVADTTQFKLDKALAQLGVSAIRFGEQIKDPVISMLESFTGKIKELTESFGYLSDVQKLATLRTLAYTAAMGPALVITARFISFFLTNPLAAAALAIAAVAGAILVYTRTMSKATVEQKIQARISELSTKQIEEQKNKVEELFKVAKNEGKTLEERKKALVELNRISPIYFGNLTLETIKTEAGAKALEYGNQQLALKIKLEATHTAIHESQWRIEELRAKKAAIAARADEKVKSKAISLLSATSMLMAGQQPIRERTIQDYKNINSELSEEEEILRGITVLEEGIAKEIEEIENAYQLALETLRELAKVEDISPNRARTARVLFELAKDIKYQEQQVNAASKETLATENDKLRVMQKQQQILLLQTNSLNPIARLTSEIAMWELRKSEATGLQYLKMLSIIRGLERELMIAEQTYGVHSDEIDLQNELVRLEFDRVTAGEAVKREIDNRIQAIGDELRMMELMKDGLSEEEGLLEEIFRVERAIVQANGQEKEELKQQLELLQLKKDIIQSIADPLRIPVGKENKPGTKAFRDYHKERISIYEGYLAMLDTLDVENNANRIALEDKYKQAIFESEDAIKQARQNTWTSILQIAANSMSQLQGLITQNYQKELAQAGENLAKKEKLEKAYNRKMKFWSFIQSQINTAVAITKALPDPALAIATAIAGELQSAIILATSFAKGGLVYGDTLARVGEYPGASTNPEVIAPLSDLKDMLQPRGGMFPQVITLRAKGRDLVGVIEMENLNRNTY